MSDWKTEIARRPLLAAALALIGVGAVGGGAYEAGLFRPRASGPYADILSLLDDLDNAKTAGAAIRLTLPDFDAPKTAAMLRTRIAHRKLDEVLLDDAGNDRVIEAQGWVLPETLALLCALAATPAAPG